MQLVILAAGHGRRFGGLKQLAPIGPYDEAIMDYTASAAYDSEYDGIVLVVREDIRAEILAHVKRRWPRALAVEMVCQQPAVPGTVQAVLAARPVLDGPFGVANADDLYGEPALLALAQHFTLAEKSGTTVDNLLVAYRLVRTVLTDAPVTRGLCQIAADGSLQAIVEHVVGLRPDGRFDAKPLAKPAARRRIIGGAELVSMNLWGFHLRMLEQLQDAVERFDPVSAGRDELILPEVINQVVSSGRDRVEVIETNERCIGITHHQDAAIVREELILEPRPKSLLKNVEID